VNSPEGSSGTMYDLRGSKTLFHGLRTKAACVDAVNICFPALEGLMLWVLQVVTSSRFRLFDGHDTVLAVSTRLSNFQGGPEPTWLKDNQDYLRWHVLASGGNPRVPDKIETNRYWQNGRSRIKGGAGGRGSRNDP
jgi:hypothetical protein